MGLNRPFHVNKITTTAPVPGECGSGNWVLWQGDWLVQEQNLERWRGSRMTYHQENTANEHNKDVSKKDCIVSE